MLEMSRQLHRSLLATLFLRPLVRLRDVPPSFFIFAIMGAVANLLWTFPTWTHFIDEVGFKLGFYRYILPAFIAAFLTMLILRMAVARSSDVTSRPARFFVVLVCAATLSVAVIGLFELSVGVLIIRQNGSHFFELWLMSSWLNTMLFGAIFGWSGFLHLSKIEYNRKFSTLLIRNSMLARQVAQSRLATARAQIDPEMVARALRTIRTRYRTDANIAVTTLEQLISYLRLAMNRVRDKSNSFASELAVLQAYLALRVVETGVAVDLRLPDGGDALRVPVLHSPPLFLIAQCMFEEALCTSAKKMLLSIEIQATSMKIGLEMGTDGMDAGLLARMKQRIESLGAGSTNVQCELSEYSTPGGNGYAATLCSD